MKLIINGEDRSFEGPLTLQGLIERLGMKTDRVAVELNREIAPRGEWEGIELADGDRLEIVHFVGGGSGADEKVVPQIRKQIPPASAAFGVGMTRC